MSPLYVAIAGAGLGGLALGQALKRAGIDFDIFENDTALDARSQGYRIRIDAQGQQALARTLSPALYALFRSTASIASTQGNFLTPQLAPATGRVPESWQQDADPNAEDAAEDAADADLSVHRQTLREILMCGIEERIHFGRGLEHYRLQDDGQVLASFGSQHSPVQCQILVGADGVNSRVRAQLAPEAHPMDTGAVCVYGKADFTRLADGARAYGGTNIIFADGFSAILDEMRFPPHLLQLIADTAPTCQLTRVDDYLYWALIGPRARLGLPPAAGTAHGPAMQQALRALTSDWHPALQHMLQASDGAAIATLPIRNGRPEATWPAGPVTLLGDAIHAMSPAGGLGANTALQDALTLAAALTQAQRGKTSLTLALAGYEADMRERACQAIAASDRGAAKLFESIESVR